MAHGHSLPNPEPKAWPQTGTWQVWSLLVNKVLVLSPCARARRREALKQPGFWGSFERSASQTGVTTSLQVVRLALGHVGAGRTVTPRN